MEQRNDLTQGPIIKKLLLFFLPILAGTLFQQLYNAVDALVVGRFVGTEALAAVGGSPAILISLIIGFCTSLSTGAAVVISQLFGARDYKKVQTAMQTAYVFCILLGLFAGFLVIAFSPGLLRLLKTPGDTYEAALQYQRIYFAGSVFMLAYNMGSGALRAVGNSAFPFLCLCVSCAVNIVLDLVFVIVFHLGVAGVAWATVIAQAISAVMATVKLCRLDENIRLQLRRPAINRTLLQSMMRIGIPAGIQSSMYGISNMILQVSVNLLGTVVVASWSMSGKIDGVYWATSTAFGSAITTFIGQNYGAGKAQRIRECEKKSMRLFSLMTVGISTGILLLAPFLLRIFTTDSAVIDTTLIIIYFFVPTYILWTIIEILSGVLRGIGDTLMPSIIIAVGICGFRLLWVLILLSRTLTLTMLCLCYPLSWFITDIAIWIYYRKKSRSDRFLSPSGIE